MLSAAPCCISHLQYSRARAFLLPHCRAQAAADTKSLPFAHVPTPSARQPRLQTTLRAGERSGGPRPSGQGRRMSVQGTINKRMMEARSVESVLAIVDSELHLFDGVNLATAVSRMSKTCDPADGRARAAQHPAFAQLKIAITRRAGELSARAVANIVHGFAAMGHHPGDALLVACTAQAAERVTEADPQGLANTLWGFAKLQFNPGGALLRAYEAAAVRRAVGFNPQHVANFLWAYATLGERMGSASLEALAAQAQTQLPSFTAQNLANMMWASAKLEYSPDDTLLRGCEAHATRNAGAFDPQALAIFPWAYATLGKPMGSACLEALAAQAQAQLPQFESQELANMMWAFAKLNYSPSAMLLRGCEAHATRIAGAFSPQELAMMLSAYASLGGRMGGACLAALVGQAQKELQHFSVQNVSMVLWSLCVLQECDMHLWRTIMAAPCMHSALPAGLHTEALSPIFQAYELMRMDMPAEEEKLTAAAPPGLLGDARAQWMHRAETKTKERVSSLLLDVGSLLRSRGVAHQQLAPTSDGLFFVDIALPGELIAIEVDGRHKFSGNTFAPGGSVIAQHRLLMARGWAVIHVPGYMWANLSDAVRGAWLLQEIQHARELQASAAALPPGAPRRVPAFADVAAALGPQRMYDSMGSAARAAGLPIPNNIYLKKK